MFHDYFQRSLRLGRAWPFNLYGLSNDNLESTIEFDAGAVLDDDAEKDLEGKSPMVALDKESEDSACTHVSSTHPTSLRSIHSISQAPWSSYVLYLLYPANNIWAAGAIEKFLTNFSEFFEVNRRECASTRPFPSDVHDEKLCMMNEVYNWLASHLI